jgi:hypothetical protein
MMQEHSIASYAKVQRRKNFIIKVPTFNISKSFEFWLSHQPFSNEHQHCESHKIEAWRYTLHRHHNATIDCDAHCTQNLHSKL